MPLRETEDPASIETVNSATDEFLIFYSSRDGNGNLWCPDCVAVDDLLRRRFEEPGAPRGLIVYVGQRSEWRSPSNVFRDDRWKVQSIPTIVRIQDGARLEEGEIFNGLDALLA